jgi:hypothetical protein
LLERFCGYFPITLRLAWFRTIFLTFGFIMALTATRRAVLLLINLTAIAFFTTCLSF